jgi:hypothetical protein
MFLGPVVRTGGILALRSRLFLFIFGFDPSPVDISNLPSRPHLQNYKTSEPGPQGMSDSLAEARSYVIGNPV